MGLLRPVTGIEVYDGTGVHPATGLSWWDGEQEAPVSISQAYVDPTWTPVDPSPGPAWPGDPGDGNLTIGWSLGPGNNTIPAVRNNLGWTGDETVSVIHNYSTNADGVNATMLAAAFNEGFYPSQSFKMQNWTPAQIAAGDADAHIDASAAACAAWAPNPIELCYYHEPEDNFPGSNTAEQQAFRAAGRRIALRFAAAGVTNVAWMPIYMCPYTFSGGSGRDWRNWHPDWQAGGGWHDTITQHVIGLDTYNPLPHSGTWQDGNRTNHAFGSMIDTARDQIEQTGNPVWDYVIPEFGMSNGATNPSRPDWLTWCQNLVTYAKANRVKSINYWDNSGDAHRYSFTATGDQDYGYGAGRKLAGWHHVVSQSIRKPAPVIP